jgi:hypothetical protein
MSHTIKVKGSVIDNPSNNAIGNAHFVHCVATGGTQTGVVKNAGGTTLGQFYLHAAGDSIVIEKSPTDTITLSDGHASACAPKS